MSQVSEKNSILNLALSKQKEIIRHEFTAEEMTVMHNTLAKNLVRLNDLEDELAKIKEGFKDKMKPLSMENRDLLKRIKNKFIDEEMDVYLVPDYDNKIMEFYNEDGVKVGERRMMISELQGRLDLK